MLPALAQLSEHRSALTACSRDETRALVKSLVYLLALLCFAGATVPATAPEKPSTAEAVFAADRALAEATRARRIDAWVEAYVEQGVQWSPSGPVTGREAIRATMTPVFADPNLLVEWTPTDGAIAPGGTLALSLRAVLFDSLEQRVRVE